MLGNPININTLCCTPAVWKKKKIGKALKKLLFLPQFTPKKESLWATHKMKKKFFLAEIATADHQLSETFYFIKIYICFA